MIENCQESGIKKISIVNYKDVEKFGKSTVVYQITFSLYNGQAYVAEKSYREFKLLYDYLNQNYKDLTFPEFPKKNSDKGYITEK